MPSSVPTTPGVVFTALDGWTETPPTQSFFLKTWALPEGGLANISWLGRSRDNIGANVQRWLGQFSVEGDSSAEAAEIVENSNGRNPFTLIVLEGTLTSVAQLGGGGPRADWLLLGAAVDTSFGPLYVKALGPASELGAQREAFIAAVETMQVR